MKAWRTGVVVLAMATTLMGAVPAQAAVATHITIAFTNNFHGKVTATKAHCVAGRTVNVFRETTSGNQLIGSTSSGSLGKWTVNVMQARGKYFARTPAQTRQGTACSGAKSNVVTV